MLGLSNLFIIPGNKKWRQVVILWPKVKSAAHLQTQSIVGFPDEHPWIFFREAIIHSLLSSVSTSNDKVTNMKN